MADTKKYYLNVYNTVTGCKEDVEVTKEVYDAYRQSYWNEKKNDMKHRYYTTPFSALEGGDEPEDCFDEFEAPEDIALNFEFSSECDRLLSVVSEVTARRIMLHYGHGYSYDEIAQMEGVSRMAICYCITAGMKKINIFSEETLQNGA